MGLADLFSRKPGRFVTEDKVRASLASQLQGNRQILDQLAGLGVTPDRRLRLEYFFYTNAAAKAESLAGAVAGLGYEVKHGKSAGDSRAWVITGWTTPILMSEPVVGDWNRQMAQLGLDHDAEFDGWGTTPDQ